MLHFFFTDYALLLPTLLWNQSAWEHRQSIHRYRHYAFLSFAVLLSVLHRKKGIDYIPQFVLYFKNAYHPYRSGECCQNSIWMNLLFINRTELGGYREFNIQLIKSASDKFSNQNRMFMSIRSSKSSKGHHIFFRFF